MQRIDLQEKMHLCKVFSSSEKITTRRKNSFFGNPVSLGHSRVGTARQVQKKNSRTPATTTTTLHASAMTSQRNLVYTNKMEIRKKNLNRHQGKKFFYFNQFFFVDYTQIFVELCLRGRCGPHPWKFFNNEVNFSLFSILQLHNSSNSYIR